LKGLKKPPTVGPESSCRIRESGSALAPTAARLRVMESAGRNIGDKLEDMVRNEHTLRQ
jgi:hypothetical protein